MLRLIRTSSFRLASAYALATALAFLVLFLLTYWIATEALNRQVRTSVEAEFDSILGEATDATRAEFAKELSDKLRTPGGAAFFYYFADESGAKLAGNLDAPRIYEGWREEPFDPEKPGKPGNSPAADDDHQLVAFGKRLKDGTFLLVGEDAYRVLAAQETIMSTFAWAALLALALSILAGLIISQRFLKRIDRINTTSRAIAQGRLKERIAVEGTSDEIDRLAVNLNSMLDSNQSLMESLKQVSSSIAHDLRTPMTRLRQNLEEARLARLAPDEYRKVIDQAVSDTDGILSTFAALLRIAHIESGSRRSGFKPVNLTALFERIAEAYRAVAEDEEKSLRSDVVQDASFIGDEELLTQMIANLVENAIKHTPPGAVISLNLRKSADGARAEISDNGSGIPEHQRHRVFEHFYRLDRSRTTPGDGLGLSLVAAVANLHGISVNLEANGPGLRVALRFGSQQFH